MIFVKEESYSEEEGEEEEEGEREKLEKNVVQKESGKEVEKMKKRNDKKKGDKKTDRRKGMKEEQKPLLVHRRSASPVEEERATTPSPRPVLKESDMNVRQTYKLYWDILKNPYVCDMKEDNAICTKSIKIRASVKKKSCCCNNKMKNR